jgi:hypothetical protein
MSYLYDPSALLDKNLQVIDLTSENVTDLTADSSFISLGLDTSASSQRNAARRDDGNFISLEMNSPAQLPVDLVWMVFL